MASEPPTRVALDLLGGDGATEVAAGAALALQRHPRLALTLVGPPEVAAELLERHPGRCTLVPATRTVELGGDPARAVRAARGASVRICARLVRDGEVDATVSFGPTEAAVAAAGFAMGAVAGMTAPAVAQRLSTERGTLVLLDVAAGVTLAEDTAAQLALAGRACTSLERPRVALLSLPGLARGRAAGVAEALAGLPVAFTGTVNGADLPRAEVDVVLTDGPVGAALVAGIRAGGPPAREGLAGHRAALAVTDGAILLGMNGVSVVGEQRSPEAVAACLEQAASCADGELVERITAGLSDLVTRRRAAAGLPPRLAHTAVS